VAIASIRDVFCVRGPVLIQEYLTGRDVNVGVMERENPKTGKIEPWVLPITEEDYSALPEDLPKICGFESKVFYTLLIITILNPNYSGMNLRRIIRLSLVLLLCPTQHNSESENTPFVCSVV
jgi:hypothetical protein